MHIGAYGLSKMLDYSQSLYFILCSMFLKKSDHQTPEFPNLKKDTAIGYQNGVSARTSEAQ